MKYHPSREYKAFCQVMFFFWCLLLVWHFWVFSKYGDFRVWNLVFLLLDLLMLIKNLYVGFFYEARRSVWNAV